MKISHYPKTAIAIAAIATVALLAILFWGATRSDAAIETNIMTRVTSASSTVSTSGSTVVLATSTSRSYARITNDSATNKVYLSFGSAAAQGKGLALPPNTSWEMTDANLFYGAIYAVASTSATNVSTIEGNPR